MSFEYKLSDAFSITGKKNAKGEDILCLEYKYVSFELTLDDPEKREELERIITGKVQQKAKPKQDVRLPKFYGGK